MAKKIKTEDIFEGDLFAKQAQSAKDFSLVLKELIAQNKELLQINKQTLQGTKIATVKDVETIEQTAKSIEKTTTTVKNLQKAEKELEKTRLEELKIQKEREKAFDKFNKQQEKNFELQKKQNSVYQQSVVRLRDLKSQLKELEITGRTNGKLYKALGAEFVSLNGKVRDAEEGVGEFFRNVGNYPQQLIELQKELRNLEPGTDEFIRLSQEAGQIKDKIKDAKEATSAFASESKVEVAKNLFSQIGADIANLDFAGAAEKAKAFAKVVSTISFKEVISGIKNFGVAIGNVGKALIKNPFTLILAAVTAAALAIKSFVDSSNAGKESLEKLGKSLDSVKDKTISLENEIKKLNIQRDLLNKKITETTAKRRNAELAYNLEYQELLKEREDVTKEFTDAILEERDGLGVKVGQIVGDALGNETDLTKRKNIGISKINEAFNLRALRLKEKFNLENKIIDDEKAAEDLEKLKKLKKERLALQVELDNIIEQGQISQTENRVDSDIKLQKEYEDEYKKSLSEILSSQKIFQDKEKKLLEQKKGLVIGALLEEVNGREQALISQANIEKRSVEISEENQKVKDEKIKQINLKLFRELNNLLVEKTKRENAIEEQAANDRIAIREKEKKQVLALINNITTQTFAEINRRKQAELQAQNDLISERKTNIQRQQELASRGLANTLEFEKKKLAESELEKKRLEQAQIRREKRQIFAKALIASLENAKGAGDIAKSFSEAVAVTTLATAFAGAFKDGIENLKGKGTGTSDSNVALLSKGESVITAKATKDYSGLATAMNSGMAEKWLMDNVGLNDSKAVENRTNYLLAQKLDKLNRTLEGKKEININWDAHDTRVETIMQDGFKKTIKHVRSKPKI